MSSSPPSFAALQLRQAVLSVNRASRNGERAPHKHLLILWALSRWIQGEHRLAPFALIEAEVDRLLREYAPNRKTSARYPFWYLQSDKLWEIPSVELIPLDSSGKLPSITTLRQPHILGGLPSPVIATLNQNPGLAQLIARDIVRANIAESLQEELLEQLGFDDDAPTPALPPLPEEFQLVTRRKRDPDFRRRVVAAYLGRCALCGHGLEHEGHPVGIEAAHIRWHNQEGPDELDNGLALCVLHHKLLDRGFWRLHAAESATLCLVSDKASGDETSLNAWLLKHHAQPLRLPQEGLRGPHPQHIDWHGREVFRGSPRQPLPFELRPPQNPPEPGLIFSPATSRRYVDCVPLLDIATAAGPFLAGTGEGVITEDTPWIASSGKLTPHNFAIRVRGDSMSPKIPDGSIALCQAGPALAGSREGKIVLVELDDSPADSGRFTLKKYHSVKNVSTDDWQHKRIELQSLNKTYPPIFLEEAQAEELRVIGVFERVLGI